MEQYEIDFEVVYRGMRKTLEEQNPFTVQAESYRLVQKLRDPNIATIADTVITNITYMDEVDRVLCFRLLDSQRKLFEFLCKKYGLKTKEK